jgi:hypothetical protein
MLRAKIFQVSEKGITGVAGGICPLITSCFVGATYEFFQLRYATV